MSDSQPRLAILTRDFAPETGGVQTYLYEIARRLSRFYELHVLTPVTGTLPEQTQIQRTSPASDTISGYLKLLRRLRPDCVLVGHAHPQLLLAALLVTLRGNRYSVLTYGNDFLAAQQRWHKPLFNWLLHRADPILTISHASAHQLRRLGIQPTAIIYPGTDPEKFVPATHDPAFPPVLLTVGRLVPRKGIDTVLGALPLLRDAYPDIQYLIAGTGPDRERLEQLVNDDDLRQSVTFLGRVSDEELPNLYQRAHLFVMPAREEPAAASIEGFGIVYLEASASGLPVVAGRSGGAVEAVRDGDTGIIVPPDDPAALAQVLRTLLEDADLRRRLGRAGRQWVEEEMNWDRAAQQIVATLRQHP